MMPPPLTIFSIARREFCRLLRDSNLVLVIFVAPLAYAALYGAIYWNKAEQDVPVAVVDYDGSPLSRRLLRDVDALQDVRVAMTMHEESGAHAALRRGDVHGVLVIPQGFSRDVKYGRSAVVHLVLSPGRLLVLSDIGINVARAVAVYGARVTGAALAAQGVPVSQHPAQVQPLSFSWQPLHNPWLTYGDMILPALMAIIVLQLVFIGSAAATASEWTTAWKDIARQLRRGSGRLIAGKLLMFVVVFLFFSLLLRITVVPLFGIHLVGSAWLVTLLLVAGFAAAAALGLFLGSFFRHRISTFIVLGFTSYPFFMLSGYAWPDGQIPDALTAAARLLPSTPFLKGVLSVTQTGAGFAGTWPLLLNLVLLSVLYAGLARWRFRRIGAQLQSGTE